MSDKCARKNSNKTKYKTLAVPWACIVHQTYDRTNIGLMIWWRFCYSPIICVNTNVEFFFSWKWHRKCLFKKAKALLPVIDYIAVLSLDSMTSQWFFSWWHWWQRKMWPHPISVSTAVLWGISGGRGWSLLLWACIYLFQCLYAYGVSCNSPLFSQ